MIIEVSGGEYAINLMPTEIEEIVQNVRTILTTVQGTVPLYREFGLSAENLDMPINAVKARLTAEIARQIGRYETRCKLVGCTFEGDISGRLEVTAKIEVD